MSQSTVEVSLTHLSSLLDKLDTSDRLSSQYFTEYAQQKRKSAPRTIDFIITSEHVDDDDEIDDIDSIDIEKMMESERGVTLTVMHTDTIVGKVTEMEKTTLGEVAQRYPDSADRLNTPTNEHVKCVLGKGKMYDDTPELDELTWHLIKLGKEKPKRGLSAVSLRGVGHTHKDSKVCDPEKKCGKQVTKTKFWSVTLCPDGEQAKPYSVILRDSIKEEMTKMTKDSDKESSTDCGGTVDEFNDLSSRLSQFETQLTEMKTKMAKQKEEDSDKEEEMEKMDCPKCNEKMSYKKGASTAKCKACGEEHDMKSKAEDKEEEDDDKEKMSETVKMVTIREDHLEELIESDRQYQQIKQRKELSKTQKYLAERFGDDYEVFNASSQQTKMSGSSDNTAPTPLQLQKMIREEAKKLIKEAPEELGLTKIRSPDTGGDGVKGADRGAEDSGSTPTDEGDLLPSFEQAQDYLIKTRGKNGFEYSDILNIVTGKTKMKQEVST